MKKKEKKREIRKRRGIRRSRGRRRSQILPRTPSPWSPKGRRLGLLGSRERARPGVETLGGV